MKENIILTDCETEEIIDLTIGLEDVLNQSFKIENKICNGKHNKLNNLYRYLCYFIYPFKYYLKRKKLNYIICWQQFFGIFYAFYCKLFKTKKENILVICNFTYKNKKGYIGKIYRKLIKYCIKNEYVDYIHVPSENYAKECAKEFEISIKKFIVIPFGINDMYEKWKDSKLEYKDYTLAIGRSNRDYDFLIRCWKEMPNNNKLIIICDQYKAKVKLPSNVILKTDVNGNNQYPYIINASLIIIPIEDGKICSGDTVLLKAMSFYKPIIVTTPSTLAEMYIVNEENGICLPKNEREFCDGVIKLINDKNKMNRIGNEARKNFLDNYSRINMGKKLGEKIKKI